MVKKKEGLPRELLDKPLKELDDKDRYLLFNYLKGLLQGKVEGEKR